MMDAAGISSLTRLAEKAGLSQTTVTRTVHRDHTPGDHTIATLAKTLRVPAKEIYKLTHGQEIQSRPWEPPTEVHRLSKRSQDAVTEIIRAMAAEQAQGEDVMGNAEHPAPMNQAAGSAATDDPNDYGLAADDSLHQGRHGQIGADDIENTP